MNFWGVKTEAAVPIENMGLGPGKILTTSLTPLFIHSFNKCN